MTSRPYLGEFEHVVLLGLVRAEGVPHATAVYEAILAATGRDVSIPAIHVTLGRLEQKGLVSSDVVPVDGRSRKTFRLEPSGARALRRSREIFSSLWDGVAPETLESGP